MSTTNVPSSTSGLYLCPDLAGTLMTAAEFDAVEDCDELYVYELIRGVLVVNPPPSPAERGPNEELGYQLLHYQRTHPQGASLDLTLHENYVRTSENRRRADRVIWAGRGRTPDARRDLPDIAVEFVSSGKQDRHRDYVDKRDEYLAAGIREYWVIDRFRRRMTVYRPADDGPSELVVSDQESFQTPLLPGFVLEPATLFAVADRLENPSP